MQKVPEMVRNYVSSAEKRREESRRIILDSAMDLFFTKGYEKTTTRDIIMKAGILNGSLYNRFRNKEDILYSIVEEALRDALGQLTELLEKEKNPIVLMNLPMAVEVYISSRNRNVAELIYEVHRSWDNLNEYVKMCMDWANEHLERYGMSVGDDPNAGIKMISLLGAVGNIAGHYAHGGETDYREVLTHLLGVSCAMFNTPVLDVKKLVERICDILEEDEIVLLGRAL